MDFSLITLICISLFMVCWGINEQVKENLLQKEPKLEELRLLLNEAFKSDSFYTGKLVPLNKRDIMSEIILYKGDKSYSINKRKIYMCLRDENGNYYPNNTLIYVLLHELSHCINKENIGHTQEFHDIFEEVLELATEKGIYNPSIPIPESYCTYND